MFKYNVQSSFFDENKRIGVPIAYTLTALQKCPQNRPIKVGFAILERPQIEHNPIGTLPAIARHKKYSANRFKPKS